MAVTARTVTRQALKNWGLEPRSGTRGARLAIDLPELSDPSSSSVHGGLSALLTGAVLACATSLPLIAQRQNNDNPLASVWKSVRSFGVEEFYTAGSSQRAVGHISGKLRELETRLGLTRSQLAAALRISRPTLYQWFSGTTPRATARDRVDVLYEFSREWGAAALGSARAYWLTRTQHSVSSLGSLLSAETIDRGALTAFVRDLSERSEPRMGGSLRSTW